MSAPEKIWTDDETMPGDPARNGYWDDRPALAWVEYTRSDLIPAMLAKARQEGFNKGVRIAAKRYREGDDWDVFATADCAILDLIGGEALAQPKPDAGQVWQPIETAPRDGAMILVCLPRMMNLIVRASYSTVHKYWRTDHETDGGITNPTFFHDGDFWMPLPAPPKDRTHD